MKVIDSNYLRSNLDGKEKVGLKAEYFSNKNLSGSPSLITVDKNVNFSWGWANPKPEIDRNEYSVRWSGQLIPPESGDYKIGISVASGRFRFYLNNELVFDEWEIKSTDNFEANFSVVNRTTPISLKKNIPVDIRIEFYKISNRNFIRLEWELPDKNSINSAIKIASVSDAVVIFAGLSNFFEGGNNDRSDILLPGEQNHLIKQVANINPKTVVVLINGSPVAMPWIKDVKAILEAYYPGQEGGIAISNILFGKVNPSGKLPETFPVKLADNPAYGLKAQIPGTDWQDVVFRTGWIYDNNLSISGGTENSTAHLSLGHLKNRGVMSYQDFQRTTFRINTSHKMLGDKLKIGQNLNVASTWEVPQPTDLGGSNMEYLSWAMQPQLPVYTEDGEWSGPIGAGFSDRNNPLHMLYIHRNNRDTEKLVFGNIYVELTPFENLLFRSNFGLDYTAIHNWWVEEAYQTGFLGRAINSLSETRGARQNWIWSNTMTYNLDIGQHSFNFLAGTEAVKEDYRWMKGYKENFALNDDYDYILNLTAGTGLQTAEGVGTGHQLLSYFGKINYALSDKYLASATLRYDGSSRFGAENKFGFFPAVTLGWRINNEEFFNVAAVSNLKMRAGLGRVGNQEIGDVARFGLYAPNYGAMSTEVRAWWRSWLNQGTAYDLKGVNTGTLPSGYSKIQSANESLKWETTDEFNIGIDFGFLEEKITGSFDYYMRKTKDILIFPPVPAAVGEGGQRWENGATVDNKGFEIVLGYGDRIGDFSFKFSE